MKPKPYVIDVVDCSGIDGEATCSNLIGCNTATVKMGGMSNATFSMINLVINAANNKLESIRCLAFWGHGLIRKETDGDKGLGVQFVSGGSRAIETRNDLGPETLIKLDTQLAQLKPYFAAGSRVELRGCGVADGDGAGVETMKRLAFIWNVKVQACKGNNVGMDWGTRFGGADVKIVEVTPNGTVNLVNGIRYDART